MELRLIWRIIARRKWTVIQGFLAVFLAAMAWTMLSTPVFEAKAKILVGDPSQSVSSLLSGIGMSSKSSQITTESVLKQNLENQKSMAVLTTLVNSVSERLQLRDSYNELYSADKLLSSQLFSPSPRPYISLDVASNTSIVELSARAPDPVQAQMIAAAMSELYMQDNLYRIRDGYSSARTFIEEQLERVRGNYIKALKAFMEEKKKEKMVDLKSESSLILQNVERLTNEQVSMAIKRHELEASIRGIKEQAGDIEKYQKLSMEFESNPLIEDLKKSLYRSVSDLEGLKAKYTDQHPEVIELTNRINETKALIKKEVEKTLHKETVAVDPVYADLAKKLAGQYIALEEIKAQEKVIPSYRKMYEDRLLKVPEKEFIHSQLQNDLDATKKVYESLLEYLHKVGVAEAMTVSDVKIIEAPLRPDNPVKPNRKLNALFGVIFGLFVGVGLGLLTEYLDNTVKDPEDLKAYGLAYLGSIPRFDLSRGGSSALVSNTDANDPMYESYRGVLTSISCSDPDKESRRILVTSVGPREGKSTTVVNLGILYSSEGRKALIVDTDLRRPSLHEYFGLPNTKGLTDALTGEASYASVIRETGIRGLSIMPSGFTPPDPGQILRSRKLRHMMDELSKEYDAIILDSAPLLIKSDAVALGDCVDGAVIVARSNVTTHQGLLRAEEILGKARVRPLGVILNEDKNGRHI